MRVCVLFQHTVTLSPRVLLAVFLITTLNCPLLAPQLKKVNIYHQTCDCELSQEPPCWTSVQLELLDWFDFSSARYSQRFLTWLQISV